ncbi:MAG: N-formylglutamate amidohydrolase [Pseudomonadota bacterium]
MLDASTIQAYQAAAVERIAGEGQMRLFSEHAGNAVPADWSDLGLPPELLETHYGWDIGARALTRGVAERTGAPAVLACYSRLFLDYNRPLIRWDLCRPDMAGIPVPGNLALSEEDKQLRWTLAGAPLKAALDEMLAEPGVLVTLHTFTRYWNGERREVDVGMTCAHDHPIIDRVSAYVEDAAPRLGLRYGRDRPYFYDPVDTNTLSVHTQAGGQVGMQFEVCNDVAVSEDGLGAAISLLSGMRQVIEI